MRRIPLAMESNRLFPSVREETRCSQALRAMRRHGPPPQRHEDEAPHGPAPPHPGRDKRAKDPEYRGNSAAEKQILG